MKPFFNGGRLYCPYCYGPFQEREIWFRCSGRIGPKGTRCAVDGDPILRARTGFSAALPPAFDADGRQLAARCPTCEAESSTRICPACHMQLPVHFGKVSSKLIALVGAKESGKTVYMTVLVHELMHRVGEDLNASISGADDETRRRFASDYELPLYQKKQLLASTTTAAATNRAPLLFRFTSETRSRLGRHGLGDPRRTLLSFFDTAGEDLRSAKSVEENVHYLSAADGVLLLLDPLQMRGARDLAAPGTKLPTLGAVGDEPANVLERVTDLIMKNEGTKARQRIAKPLAIVFTKIDALLHEFRETSPLRQPPVSTPYFDERDGRAVHAEIQRRLARWEGSRIDQIAQKNYQAYRYFGVSALGETPTIDNSVSPGGFVPTGSATRSRGCSRSSARSRSKEADMAFQQLYYTSCETGLAGFGGYQFNAVTPGTSPAVMREVEGRSSYEPPRWLLAEPCPDEPEAYPTAFSYAKSETTKAVILTHVQFAGRDYSGRPGNYFAHALVTSSPERDLGPPAAGRAVGRRALAARRDRGQHAA